MSIKNIDPFEAVLEEDEGPGETSEADESRRTKVDNPRQATTDLPAVHTTTGGMPTQYMWITTMTCPSCKGGTGGARIGIIKDLGGGSLTGECENPNCRHTVHLLVSMLGPKDQQKHAQLSMRRY